MKADDILILAPNVLITSIETLDPEVKKRFSYQQGDYLVSRPNSRSRSLIIEHSSALFLEQFRSPKTMIEAIIGYSIKEGMDPENILDGVIPLISRMRQLNYLVISGTIEENIIKPTISINTFIENYQILSCIHLFENIEVYKAVDIQGHEYAVKILRHPIRKKSLEMLERESTILKLLNWDHSPSLIWKGEFENRPYIVMTWCNGKDLNTYMKEHRKSLNPQQNKEILKICIEILRIYNTLHRHGIAHGDIHPNNILVNEDGQIKLIDFGFGLSIDEQYNLPSLGRGGIAEYMEPEYCLALAQRSSLPKVTKFSEEYALAALCYFLITGKHYLDFNLERERWISQILYLPPRSFMECGLPSWPAVEKTLTKALAKTPSQRYNSLSGFLLDLESAIENNIASQEPPKLLESHNLLNDVIQKFGIKDCSIPIDLLDEPKCSINYGASGIAYFFYRLACLRHDPALLSIADIWSSWSRENIGKTNAFHSSEIGITAQSVGPYSLYHSETGVYYVQALINQAMGDLYSANKSIYEFIAKCNWLDNRFDLTLGLASLLIGCSSLVEIFSKYNLSSISVLKKLGERILSCLLKNLFNEQVITSKIIPWFGIAHGWAGIIYSIMRWQQANKIKIVGLEKKLYELANLGVRKDSVVSWPIRQGYSSFNRSPRTGWCHGSAGYIILWSLAYQNFGDKYFLQLAKGASKHIIKSIDTFRSKSGSLCCGYAGQGYALLSLYRITKNKYWLDSTKILCDRAIQLKNKSQRRSSLYKGDIGIALLIADIDHPDFSCFPLFESEGWRSL